MAAVLSLLALFASRALASPCPTNERPAAAATTAVARVRTQWADHSWPGMATRTSSEVDVTSASTSASTSATSAPTNGAYIVYTAVPGYFLQDSNATNPDGFDYAAYNFGLINQTYPSSPSPATSTDADQPQW